VLNLHRICKQNICPTYRHCLHSPARPYYYRPLYRLGITRISIEVNWI